MGNSYKTLSLWTIVIAFFVLQCADPTGPEDHSGGSSPIPNPPAIIGIAEIDQSSNLTNTAINVNLFQNIFESNTYTSLQISSTITDSNGMFKFDSLDTGNYSVVLYKNAASETLRAFSGYETLFEDTGIVDIGTIVLTSPQKVFGSLEFLSISCDEVVLSLIGLGEQDTVKPEYIRESFFVFESIPKGDYKISIATNCNTSILENYLFSFPTKIANDTTYEETSNNLISTIIKSGKIILINNEVFEFSSIVSSN